VVVSKVGRLFLVGWQRGRLGRLARGKQGASKGQARGKQGASKGRIGHEETRGISGQVHLALQGGLGRPGCRQGASHARTDWLVCSLQLNPTPPNPASRSLRCWQPPPCPGRCGGRGRWQLRRTWPSGGSTGRRLALLQAVQLESRPVLGRAQPGCLAWPHRLLI